MKLTSSEVETIRIHMNAVKEALCNQGRWNEAQEYQNIVDNLDGLLTAESVIRCKDCKYRQEHHYEDDGEEPYIKLACSNRFGLNGKEAYRIYDSDFCSRAERKEE